MAHSVHDVDEAAEYLPFAQVVHETALYVLENVPTAHLAHEPIPALTLNVPGAQAGVGDDVGDVVG